MAKATWDTAKGYQMFLEGESDAAIAKAVGIASSTLNYYGRYPILLCYGGAPGSGCPGAAWRCK